MCPKPTGCRGPGNFIGSLVIVLICGLAWAGPVTARGVCWSTVEHPLADDPHSSDGAGVGVFTSSITGLTPGSTYFVRAWATNGRGTAYGETVEFRQAGNIPIMGPQGGLTLVVLMLGSAFWLLRRRSR